MRSQCNSCQADIIWTISSAGKRAPIDYLPTAEGTIAVEKRDLELPHSRVVEQRLRFGRKDLRTSHFATCPNADGRRDG